MAAKKHGCKIDTVFYGDISEAEHERQRWPISIFFENGVTRDHRLEIIELLKRRGTAKDLELLKTSPKGIAMVLQTTAANIGKEAHDVIELVKEYLRSATPKPEPSRTRRGHRRGKTLADEPLPSLGRTGFRPHTA